MPDRGEDASLDLRDMRPHAKPNMPSRIGRFVDRATYFDIIILACLSVSLSCLYFTFAPTGQGMDSKGSGPLDAAYFSIVTFSSLGYGDIAPQGFGRAVAILLVIFGLSLTALLIGKVASERQSSLLFLLHTSDIQRRISEFTSNITSARTTIDLANELHQIPELRRELRSFHTLIGALANYLSFNAFQVGIVEFGNFSALSALYDELSLSFDENLKILYSSVGYEDPTLTNRALSNCSVIFGLIRLMRGFHLLGGERTSLIGGFLRLFFRTSATLRSNAENSTVRKSINLGEATRINYQKLWSGEIPHTTRFRSNAFLMLFQWAQNRVGIVK